MATFASMLRRMQANLEAWRMRAHNYYMRTHTHTRTHTHAHAQHAHTIVATQGDGFIATEDVDDENAEDGDDAVKKRRCALHCVQSVCSESCMLSAVLRTYKHAHIQTCTVTCMMHA